MPEKNRPDDSAAVLLRMTKNEHAALKKLAWSRETSVTALCMNLIRDECRKVPAARKLLEGSPEKS